MPPLTIGTIAGTKGKPAAGSQPDTREPIRLSVEWTKPWGQVIPVTARNNDNHEILTLREELHGFYAYKISCDCPEVQRSGLPSVIKIGRSAGDSGGLKSRLQSYPVTHSMNDITLLKVIVFKMAKHAVEFEKHIKQALLSRGIIHVVGYEWFNSNHQSELITIINEVRDELKSVEPRSRSATPAVAGGSGGSGGSGLVAGRITRATPLPPAQSRAATTGRVYPSKPAPARTASLDLKKKFVKNAAMKLKQQAERDGKPEAYQKEVYKTVVDKWNAYYGI